MGLIIVVDTNILINLSEGKQGVDNYLEGNRINISVITEIELLGWHRISEKEKLFFQRLLEECKIYELTVEIKSVVIGLKQKHKIKTPDAIIAATAIYLEAPLLTYDSGFEKIKDLNLVLLN